MKQKQKRSVRIAIALVLIMLFQLVGFVMPNIYAEGEEESYIEITDVNIYDSAPQLNEEGEIISRGNEIEDNSRLDTNSSIGIICDWKLLDDHQYKNGDTFKFTLPDLLDLNNIS